MVVTLDKNIDHRLLLILRRAVDMTIKVRKIELDQYHISPIEAFALFCIHTIGDGATAAEVSRIIGRQHNTEMALLRRMEKKGLLTKTRDLERGTIWRISLTQKGELIRRQSMKLNSVHGVMASFSEDEKKELESFLKTICDNANMQLTKVTTKA
jgi:DNA-binding MarR family transcriptional regulator